MRDERWNMLYGIWKMLSEAKSAFGGEYVLWRMKYGKSEE